MSLDQWAPTDSDGEHEDGEHPGQPAQLPAGSAASALMDRAAANASPPVPGRRKRLLIRLLAAGVAFVLVIGVGAVAAALLLQHHYNHNIERFNDPSASIPAAGRPAVVAAGALNILLLGSDSRISAGDPANWQAGAQRTDAIMIAHVPADRSAVTITSIPRDSWVNVPGHGMNKINAGFSFGGPALEVQTIEQLTGVRIDHVVIVDFDGFKEITDDLGGVQIDVAQATHDKRASFAAGEQMMNGEQALNYVRQRHNLPGGDFDRVRRQQNWIRAVGLKTLDKGTLTHPVKLSKVLGALTKSIAADNSFSIGKMRSLAISLRNVRGNDLTFVTAPVAGTGRSANGQDIVLLATKADKQLWTAISDDKMPDWLAAHPNSSLGDTVR